MNSLIGGQETLLVWMAVIAVVALAITTEQKWKWGARVSSTVMCIFGGMILANIRVIPFESPVYGAIGGIVLPLSIPLLLFKADLKKIIRESGRTFYIFCFTAFAAFLGTMLVPLVFSNVASISEFAAMLGGAVTGGTVNAVAMSRVFAVPTEYLFALSIVGNFFVGMMVFIFNMLYNSKFFRKRFYYSHTDNIEMDADASMTAAAAFWKSKDISLKNIAQAFALTFLIVGLSSIIARTVNGLNPPFVVAQLFGNIFLLMTIITTTLATSFPKFFASIKGSDELGTLLMLAWFVTIGSSANIVLIIQDGLIVLVSYTIVFLTCCLLVFSIGRKFKWDLENMMACMNASIGGPPTVAALCISMRWQKLIVPGILVGLFGVIVGNFIGLIIGNIWGALPFGG